MQVKYVMLLWEKREERTLYQSGAERDQRNDGSLEKVRRGQVSMDKIDGEIYEKKKNKFWILLNRKFSLRFTLFER